MVISHVFSCETGETWRLSHLSISASNTSSQTKITKMGGEVIAANDSQLFMLLRTPFISIKSTVYHVKKSEDKNGAKIKEVKSDKLYMTSSVGNMMSNVWY